MNYAQNFLAGVVTASNGALYNGFTSNNTQDLIQLGVKFGGGTQFLRFKISNAGAIDFTNVGSAPSLKLHNGTGRAIVAYANNGSKILQLEDDGLLRSRRIKIDTDSWADYVFKQGYYLMTLSETENYIKENGHLPGVPSENEITENGLDIGEMQKIQMEKMEEMYLHLIEMDKKIIQLQEENKSLKTEIANKN